MSLDRRQVMIGTAGAAAALAWPGFGANAAADADVHIELHAAPDQVELQAGAPTRVWRYKARLLRGDAGVLDTSMLAPIIRVRRGQRVRIDMINGLPESTIIHWHGLHVPEAMDGHPRHAVGPGERYVYDFVVDNRAGSYWFHPHPHGRTGKQVYAGLAGLFLVSDDEEAAVGLPGGAHDLPLVIQDRILDANNQFVYLDGAIGAGDATEPQRPRRGMMGEGMMGGGHMGGHMGGGMGSMMGVLGDRMLINGSLQPIRTVERRAYRLRLLNASNTRSYRLAWHDGTPLTVIGTDGGLLSAPLQRDAVMLAPGERVDLWVDFGRWAAGTELALRSLAFDGGVDAGGMMGRMMGGGPALADGAIFTVHRFRIGEGAAQASTLPARLSSIPPAEPRMAVNFARPKVFELTMGMMVWGINGAGFDMLGASELETVKLGTEEIWEFRNDGRGSMMGMVMPHSMHVHGLQFRVIGRSASRQFAGGHDTFKASLVDEGWKDTVLVMPGERVRILLRFADHTGLFLYHCHMLEH